MATDDSLSAPATATAETTPLLGSETASSLTARDVSPLGSKAQDGEPPLSRERVVCIVLSMWVLIFLQASNMSGISTTQGTIAADLDAYENAMWLTSSYLISMSSVAPLVGRFAQQFSPGAMILFSSFFFSLGAIVTSQARSFAVFILGRVLVGVGGGGIMTLSLILVIQLTSKRRRGLMIGLTNAGFTIGLSTGAIAYGALMPVVGWRAVFWMQSPLGMIGGLGVYFSIPSSATHPASKGQTTLQKLAAVDYVGALTLNIAIVFFLYSMSTPTIQFIPLLLSLLVLLPLFLLIESLPRLTPNPILPLSILSDTGILFSCLSQLTFMAARWTVLFYAPVFALAVRGLSPAAAGAALIPTNLGFGSGGLIIGWLHIRRAGSFWFASVVSLVLFGFVILALSGASTLATPAWLYISIIFAHGLCTGAALNYTLAHLLHLSHPAEHFIVTGLLSTFRGFAGSFGTAIGGGLFGRTLRGALVDGFTLLDGQVPSEARQKLITMLVGSPGAVYKLGVEERAVAILGYEIALKVLYRASAAVCVLVLVLQAATGWKGPVMTEEEEEVIFEEVVVEHDGRMEA
ncbi:major facilitator superfamily domain-containing protein [Cercophora newfieldiana]|uniref:Major facilitator superfamily domain-containing protein n=1 Tax=Cercophora newfieldiana TaxID=92897 RepID=A0AA40CWC1_9PEZI|nr:major facilitator superfamily domain-containing protein [Cercophora newfieldiana]